MSSQLRAEDTGGPRCAVTSSWPPWMRLGSGSVGKVASKSQLLCSEVGPDVHVGSNSVGSAMLLVWNRGDAALAEPCKRVAGERAR